MLKRLMISTAAAALVVGSAVAQQTPPPAPKDTPRATQEMPKATAPAPGAQSGERQFVTQQTADQWLASKFRGTDVMGSTNEKIGDVNDILFDRQGKILAYVIGVGGFLGIGSKDVALAPASFQVEMDGDEVKLKLAMTKDELENAPEFKAHTERRTAPTTGQAPQRERTPATPPAQR